MSSPLITDPTITIHTHEIKFEPRARYTNNTKEKQLQQQVLQRFPFIFIKKRKRNYQWYSGVQKERTNKQINKESIATY